MDLLRPWELPIRNSADLADIERVPLKDRLTASTTYDLIRRSAEDSPNTPALIWLPQGRAVDAVRSWNYAEFFARVTQTANLLHARGVSLERPLSLLLPNLPETHFLLWGGSAAGQVNPVNPFLTPVQIAEIMIAAGSRALAVTAPSLNAELWEKAQQVRKLVPQFETLIVVGDIDDTSSASVHGVVAYDLEIDHHPADHLVSGRGIQPDDVATYFHTGGTTGAPKLAQQTHWNQVCMAWIFGAAIGSRPGDRFLVGLPLFHANAAIASGLTALASRATIVLAGQLGFRDKGTMGDFWRMVDRFQISVFSGVPTILANLLDLPSDGCNVSSLRICVCGAAPLPVSLFRSFEAKTGLKILEAYGMTEGTLCSTINPRDGARRIGSVGMRLPYHQIKNVLLDDDGNYVRDCEVGEVGVLLLKGDTVTPGYKQDLFNRKAWPHPGWFNSGDLARRDADGYFWLTGRAKDLIIRSGHNIDPAVIEEALHRHPAVELAAVVGKPDPYAGELPIAFVSLRPGVQADAEALRKFAREQVPERPAAPVEVRIIDKIPTTAVGKIFKPTLREMVVKSTVEAVLATAGLRHPVRVSSFSDPSRGVVARIATTGDEAEIGSIKEALSMYTFQVDVEQGSRA